MARICEIIDKFEKFAPLVLAEEWDNCGLLIGNADNEVDKVMVCLDVDENVAKEATEKGVGLIMCHHPIMFNAIKRITANEPEGRMIIELIRNNIALYASHTNLDATKGGLNDYLCDLFGVVDTMPIETAYTGATQGIGRVGRVKSPVSLKELAERVKLVLGVECVQIVGDFNAIIESVAVCSGGGGGYINNNVVLNADVYISGDIKYSQARDAKALGLNLIILGHYDSEIIAKNVLGEFLRDNFPSVEVFESVENRNVLRWI